MLGCTSGNIVTGRLALKSAGSRVGWSCSCVSSPVSLHSTFTFPHCEGWRLIYLSAVAPACGAFSNRFLPSGLAAITVKVLTDLLMLCAHVEKLILNVNVEYLKTILVIGKPFLNQDFCHFWYNTRWLSSPGSYSNEEINSHQKIRCLCTQLKVVFALIISVWYGIMFKTEVGFYNLHCFCMEYCH